MSSTKPSKAADTTILFYNATILTHSPSPTDISNYRLVPLRNHALLVTNNRITKIAPSIHPPSADTKVIDCTHKILSPGFIDTHHHLWQTQLKGRHANELLLDYMGTGNLQSSNYDPTDVFWGELGGCLESIDGGTTTVVDHAHMNYSQAHSNAALNATVSSGIRSFYCYCPTLRVRAWEPFEVDPNILPDWVMQGLETLAEAQPFGNGRVRLGFAFDGLFLPKWMVVDLFDKVRALGIKLITTHDASGAIFGFNSAISKLASYNLLGPDIIFSHSNNGANSSLLRTHGGSISSTPDTELQMGLGLPVCFHPELYLHSSLGIDCHSNNSADILTQMRLALQTARGLYHKRFTDQKKAARKINATVQDAFNLGTVLGARAVGMEDQIGSLAVGKLADILVIDATSPAMVCAVEQDPVAALVQHASIRDIEMVIVDGQVRKEAGKLLPVTIDAKAAESGAGLEGMEVSWKDVARNLLRSRERIEARIRNIDFEECRKGMIKAWNVNKRNIVN
ncbi:hypothetical protein MMC12_008074 [Toensbergia leucococca]|nr:hypothetical protein [Toensbergia leucococca]